MWYQGSVQPELSITNSVRPPTTIWRKESCTSRVRYEQSQRAKIISCIVGGPDLCGIHHSCTNTSCLAHNYGYCGVRRKAEFGLWVGKISMWLKLKVAYSCTWLVPSSQGCLWKIEMSGILPNGQSLSREILWDKNIYHSWAVVNGLTSELSTT